MLNYRVNSGEGIRHRIILNQYHHHSTENKVDFEKIT